MKKTFSINEQENLDDDATGHDNEAPLVKPLTESQGKALKREETINRFTMLQDESEIPVTNELLDWRLFNVDFYSSDRQYSEIERVVEENLDKMIDIRPYIIDTPYLAQSTDRLPKVLDVFRHMHLRTLPVTNPGTGSLEGVITR